MAEDWSFLEKFSIVFISFCVVSTQPSFTRWLAWLTRLAVMQKKEAVLYVKMNSISLPLQCSETSSRMCVSHSCPAAIIPKVFLHKFIKQHHRDESPAAATRWNISLAAIFCVCEHCLADFHIWVKTQGRSKEARAELNENNKGETTKRPWRCSRLRI